MKTILIVDDKLNLVRLLQDYLGSVGYQTVAAENGHSALFAARHARPDLVLLDLMMPQLDGFGFLERFRQESGVPVIVLTARERRENAVQCLSLGADDYVTKPFDLPELEARISAVLRRAARQAPESQPLRVGELTLDPVLRTVTRGKEPLPLTPAEYAVLHRLMLAPGRVASRSELLGCIEGDRERSSLERTVDVHVRKLRLKIESDPAQPRYLLTVFGAGYRLNPDALLAPA
ncbi:response regulator transcription factor [Deinococcus hopiensis]|uniref:DNA-binding response regulator, OmpR family, contains REC and winged-helix (WHTH) domain n=1 Tax=Deinococcus hopiensis KR-140 TaxID=695939 RepID=A0A1W1UDS9_9DEIO|nr:response regulator transcription factor [Deinococcus hopiensis]SMB79248.1 DNA-binding response regulator, OmpR family, contains REC and winged-helix (wHTH) domain [Deinococcus hopiensis KR-140]